MKRLLFSVAFMLFGGFLFAQNAYALQLTQLEAEPYDTDKIEIIAPADGHDFSANFLDNNQELTYQASITNDSAKSVKINSISLPDPNNNFFEFSYSGINAEETLLPGETRNITLSVRTNNNDTITTSEIYNLTIDFTEISETDDEEKDQNDNPNTAASTIVSTTAITIATISIITFVLIKSSKRRFYVILFAIPALGLIALTQNTSAEENDSFSITGDIFFTNVYTVTVDPDGGVYDGKTEASVTMVRDGQSFHVNEATRPTYSFLEWEVNPGQLDENNDLIITSDTYIHAVWEENHFTLTINPNGGTYNGVSEISSFTYREGKEAEIDDAERSTYNFEGWTIEPTTSIVDGKIVMDQNYTLTANWSEIYYTLTINPNGGVHDGHSESYTQDVRAGSKVCLTSPTRDTFSFTGWISNEVVLDHNSCFYMEENAVIDASWDEVFYTLTVNPNGGKYRDYETTFTQQKRANTEVCLDSPVRATYSFDGWSSEDTTLDERGCFIIAKNTSFIANWSEIYYTLTIDPNGGDYSGHTEPFTTSYRAGNVANLATPSRTGYNFDGWTKNETETYKGATINMNENIVLVANWEDIYFDVTVDPNGGAYNNSTDVWHGRIKYGESIDLTNISWENNELTNWTQNDEEIPADTTTIEIYEDTDFVAFWQSTIFHTVTIIPNGGTYDGSTEPKEYQVRQGTDYTFLEATRDDGYAFEDWYRGNEVRADNKYLDTKITVMQDETFIANYFKIVARIERTQKVYPSIMAAHTEANPDDITGDTITLLVNTEEIVTNEKDITLDLNNHTITGYLTNTASGDLTLINGEINNYTSPIIDETNSNGAAVINNGSLTMGIDDYQEDDTNNKEPLIDAQNIRLIGTEVGLQQNNLFYFYDGFIEGDLGLVGGYDGSPWYRNTFDGVVVYYFPFVTHNTTKDCQHVELSNADKAVSKTSVHGDIYYYNLQDNIDTSAMTGFQIYAVRDFDASYTLTVPENSEDIVFDIVGYEINLGDNVTINDKLTIKDSKTGDEAGLLTSSKTIVNNSTLKLENVTISALTANTLMQNNGALEAIASTLVSDKGIVLSVDQGDTTVNMDSDSYIKSLSNSPALNNNSPNFTLVSGNITGKNCAVQNNSGKTFSMNGGKITSPSKAICNNSGTVNINGGEVAATGEDSRAINSEYGALNITGGDISSVSTATNWSSNYAINEYRTPTNITSGTIRAESASSGYTYAISGGEWNGTLTIDGPNVVISAKNTGSGYASTLNVGETSINIKQGTLSADANTGTARISDAGSATHNISGGTLLSHSKSGEAYGFSRLSSWAGTINMTGGEIRATADNPDKLGVAIANNYVNITGGYAYGTTYGILGDANGYTSSVVIGTDDGTIYNGQDGAEAKPIIQGGSYGLYKGNITFSDGIIKGGVAYINNQNHIRAIPDGSNFVITTLDDPVEEDCWLEEDEDYLQLSNGTTLNSLSKAFELAEDNDTITVLTDKTTPAIINNNQKNLSLDLNGHTLSYTQTIPNSGKITILDSSTDKNGKLANIGSTNTINNNGTLTIESGTVTGHDCAIKNNSGSTFTMNGGTTTSTARTVCSYSSTTNIYGGEVTATGQDSRAIYSEYGTLNITGGTISSTNTATNWSSNYAISEYRTPTNITGGTIRAESTSSGYAYAVSGGDWNGTVTVDSPDVAISAQNTGSGAAIVFGISDATVNIKQGTMNAEAKSGTAYISNASSATHNVSGGTMLSHSESGEAYGFNHLSTWSSTTNVTGGEIRAIADNPDKLGVAIMNNYVNITDGYAYGTTYGILGLSYGTTSTVTIGANDGTIYNGQAGVEAKPIIQGGTEAIHDGYILFYDGILKGGTAYINNEEIIKAIPDGASRVITQLSDPIEEDCWLEEDEDYLQLENGETYNSLTAALNAAKETETMTVIRDASTEAVLPSIEKNIVLDLNGHSLFYSQTLTNSKSLTIKDSSADQSGTFINNNPSVRTITNNGTFVLESGKISGRDCPVQNNSGSTFIMNGGTVTSATKAVCNNSSTATINGGQIIATGPDSYAIYSDYGSLTITGGTISSTNTATNWSSNYAVREYRTLTNITGGTIRAESTSSGYTYAVSGGDWNGTVTVDGPDAKIIAVNTGGGSAYAFNIGDTSVNIKQGTINAEAKSGTAYISNASSATHNVSGGTMLSHSESGEAYGFNHLSTWSSTTNVTGGEIRAIADNPDKLGVAIMNNTVTATGGYIHGSTYGILGLSYDYISSITIGENDGTIYNGQAGVEAKPIIIGGSYGIYQGNVNFYDGILKGQVDGYYDRNIKKIADQSYMHQGAEVIEGNEYITKYLAEEEDLARIGDTKYKSIQAAVNASSEDDTIVLLKDNYVFNPINIPADKKFTIDTYGFNIITGAYIENNGNMTMINSKKDNSNPVIAYKEGNRFILNKTGAILRIDDLKFQTSNNAVINEEGATLTLNRVDFKSSATTLQNSGTLYVNDSSITGSGSTAISQSKGQLNINNSTITAYNAVISINGGNATVDNSTINLSFTSEDNRWFEAIYTSPGTTTRVSNSTLLGAVYNQGNVNVSNSMISQTKRYNHPVFVNSGNESIAVIDNSSVISKQLNQYTGYNWSAAIENSAGNMTIQNQTEVKLEFENTDQWFSLSGEARVVHNSGTLNISDSSIENTAITVTKDNGRTYGIFNAGGTISFTNSEIELTRYESYGVYNDSGTTNLLSGSVKAGGYNARGLWIKNGSVNMGEAEPTDSPDYGKETADVSTTEPYVEALGSNSGIGVTLETGNYRFYDGKILQKSEVGPAVQPNGVDKATVTEVEYLYQPEKHQDESGNYYFVLEFMR